MSAQKPVAVLRVPRPLYLYADRLEERFGLRGRRVFPLDDLSVKVQTMGGGIGHITLRKQEATLTVWGPNVAVTRTAKGSGINKLMQFEAALLSVLSTWPESEVPR
jgi:hypothetical protein